MDTTKNPTTTTLKMISGAYLGAFSHVVVEQAIEEGLLSKVLKLGLNKLPPSIQRV